MIYQYRTLTTIPAPRREPHCCFQNAPPRVTPLRATHRHETAGRPRAESARAFWSTTGVRNRAPHVVPAR